ncbi:MAG TPA: DUF3127 domain-containing protein, partial [Alistipes communis]|nr:DUF3127 domain-containing protein [Alistipes communis]
MEFEGVVYKIMPVTRGTSARGEWQRQDVVFDYNDGGQFSRKICVTFFNKEIMQGSCRPSMIRG